MTEISEIFSDKVQSLSLEMADFRFSFFFFVVIKRACCEHARS